MQQHWDQEAVESADTFDEIALHLSKYNIEEIGIDIWENRPTPKEVDGLQLQPKINYNLLVRIVLWLNNYGEAEGLTEELFHEVFGEVQGGHYYSKWIHTYRMNLLKMIGYFGKHDPDGELFLTMVETQMNRYERRIGRDE